MIKFKDIIFEENVAIHCPEEWMEDVLLEYADSKTNIFWRRFSYLGCWREYKKNTVYYICNGAYGSIDHARKNNYKILHYNDAVIKDETSLDYELIIKGRKAEIGSELWYKDEEWIENIFITGIFISNKTRRINYKSKNRTGVIDVETMGDSLFWEKPTIYQLPDTDGNLSEVKVGQEVYLTEVETNDIYVGNVVDVSDNIFCIRWKNDSIISWVKNGNNLTNSGQFKVTTNKPHRDFSDCPHWEDVPKAKYWAVDRDGI